MTVHHLLHHFLPCSYSDGNTSQRDCRQNQDTEKGWSARCLTVCSEEPTFTPCYTLEGHCRIWEHGLLYLYLQQPLFHVSPLLDGNWAIFLQIPRCALSKQQRFCIKWESFIPLCDSQAVDAAAGTWLQKVNDRPDCPMQSKSTG